MVNEKKIQETIENLTAENNLVEVEEVKPTEATPKRRSRKKTADTKETANEPAAVESGAKETTDKASDETAEIATKIYFATINNQLTMINKNIVELLNEIRKQRADTERYNNTGYEYLDKMKPIIDHQLNNIKNPTYSTLESTCEDKEIASLRGELRDFKTDYNNSIRIYNDFIRKITKAIDNIEEVLYKKKKKKK